MNTKSRIQKCLCLSLQIYYCVKRKKAQNNLCIYIYFRKSLYENKIRHKSFQNTVLRIWKIGNTGKSNQMGERKQVRDEKGILSNGRGGEEMEARRRGDGGKEERKRG